MLDPDIRAYYDRGGEAGRLDVGARGVLEFERTKELVLRHAPGLSDRSAAPLRVLDVGGGPGTYALWLAELGHEVLLIEPVPLHVEQAGTAHPAIRAEVGDARHLDVEEGSYDMVLLLGPLYHLQDGADRLRALREAHRALRAGGVLFAAAIGRFAALLDLLLRFDRFHEPGVAEVVRESVRTGVFRGGREGLFTEAYFHLPSELEAEVADAGLTDVQVYNLEGPGFLTLDTEERWADPERREALLEAARLVESEPEFRAAASHLLAVGRRP